MGERLRSGRLGGYGEPMTGVILNELARARALRDEGKNTSAAEVELVRGLSEELKRANPGGQHQESKPR